MGAGKGPGWATSAQIPAVVGKPYTIRRDPIDRLLVVACATRRARDVAADAIGRDTLGGSRLA